MRKLLLILTLLLFTLQPTAAQEILQLDQLTSGELTPEQPTASYFIAVKAGQPLHITAVAATNGLVPQGALYSPSGTLLESYPNQNNSPSLEIDLSTGADGILRLDISSANAQLGKFVIIAQEAAPPTPFVQLAVGGSINDTLQPNAKVSYSLIADPNSRQILDVTTDDPQASLDVQLEDVSGNVLASVETQSAHGELLIPTGNSGFVVTLNNPQDTAVAYTVAVMPLNGLVSTPVPSATTLPTATTLPVATTITTCTVTPRSTAVNVRTGPSTAFSVFASLPFGATMTGVARNPEGTWYQVDTGAGLGWVSTSVVVSEGPCTSLQVVFIPTPTFSPPTLTATAQATISIHCAPYDFYHEEDNGAYMTIALPQGAVGDVISYSDGYHTQYVFPTCRAILWTSVSFTCKLSQSGLPLWFLSNRATFDWNATCGSNTNTNQSGLSFGVK